MAMAEDEFTQDGTVDIHKNPANRKKTGNWKACRFILGMVLLLVIYELNLF
jgi:peptide/histidine transporter 3/4